VTVPWRPSRVIWSSSWRRVVASRRTTAGMAISRATTAPWERVPPRSRMRPAALVKRGVQEGSVLGQTRM
jgi:hypothetical protein